MILSPVPRDILEMFWFGNCLRGTYSVRLCSPTKIALPSRGWDVEKAEGDVLDMASLRKAMQGINLVYHLAGMITIMPGS